MAEPTVRLYLDDAHSLHATARILAVDGGALALDQTNLYPAAGVLWHHTDPAPPPDLPPGIPVELHVNPARRESLARYHTVLRVLNTIAIRDYDGWITGAQIGVDYSRIDFRLENFSPALAAEMEKKANAAIAAGGRLQSRYIPEAEYHARPRPKR